MTETAGQSLSARIVGKLNPAVELQRLQTGKQEQCLNEIHLKSLNLGVVGAAILDRKLIGTVLRIPFQLTAHYMIRALKLWNSLKRELAVNLDGFHFDILLALQSGRARHAKNCMNKQPTAGQFLSDPQNAHPPIACSGSHGASGAFPPVSARRAKVFQSSPCTVCA